MFSVIGSLLGTVALIIAGSYSPLILFIVDDYLGRGGYVYGFVRLYAR